jgi:hypothetical protein
MAHSDPRIAHAFMDALISHTRSPDIAETDDLFGFLIGSWDIDAVLHTPGGESHTTKGEVHATWVLEGRAIQDLFIFPRRADRSSGTPAHGDRYATTIRTFDRALDAWRVTFINPADPETSAELIARRRGPDIAMAGTLRAGTPIRWRYASITSQSFRYTAERLRREAQVWVTYLELFGNRSGS